MTLPVLTAVTGAAWESRLVAELEQVGTELAVVRRCVDVADLLAAAAAGHGRAVLLSADLRQLDRDALAKLSAAGLAVVGVVATGDEGAERRLRQLGVARVVPADASAHDVAAAVHAAVGAAGDPAADPGAGAIAGLASRQPSAGIGDPARALPLGVPQVPAPGGSVDAVDAVGAGAGSDRGRLVAVWGPTGAPGRTSVAAVVAGEAAARGVETLLADADTYGGAVAQCLGLLDEAPGLAAACRAANAGRLDLPGLARHARQVASRLRVLTGIVRSDRWPELRPASLEVVWTLARHLADLTVVDCGFCLEQDEEILFDTAAPRRNAATLVTLEHADVVVAVGSADPVGLQRLVRGLDLLRDTVPVAELAVVVNRVRAAAIGSDPAGQVREALARHAGIEEVVLVPDDRPGFDLAVARGRMLAEVAPGSPALPPLRALAEALAGVPAGRLAGRPAEAAVAYGRALWRSRR